jgi:uncharacterized protein (DUF952 family)
MSVIAHMPADPVEQAAAHAGPAIVLAGGPIQLPPPPQGAETRQMTDIAYKLVARAEWEAARATGAFLGSAFDLSDGYIHMSTSAQLAETARKHFAGQSDLLLVEVPLAPLGEALKWEVSRSGGLFPHLYAPLPLAVTGSERALSVDADGVMRFQDGAVGWP